MTRPDGPPPAIHPPTDAEYVRKLALAILSTLQNKGLLTPDEVDAILIAARRAAQQGGTPPAAPVAAQPTPAARPPLKFQVTAQPSGAAPAVEWSVKRPPGAPVQEQKPEPDQQEQAVGGGKPPMIDIQLD
ncbi:hypothetical protein [Deinococcus hopiensis]|uniref:Uncharacterized protein n=1 Tax=Deinococcus hopiensis KR-140 TaxID=695939 RepID=A0A1W1VIN7_9DEIO|nr:hypothetical protein [Deinococcus hopiensis]SMB92804.1 hypothetical protein SAMN00790413_01731 [Deinococcus hopiensis KR-140]